MDNQDNNKTKVNHPILDNNNDPSLDNNDPVLDNDPSLDNNDPVLDSTEPIRNNNFKEETSAELMDEEANWNTRDDDNDHFRSEEHTSELQSRGHLVCRLLLEKKKH